MSHIIDADIQGLAGKKGSTQISFDRSLNIVYGPNGTGKTSLLKILHGALAGEAESLLNVPFVHATVRFYSRTHDAIYTRTLDKAVLTDKGLLPAKRALGSKNTSLRSADQKPEVAWRETESNSTRSANLPAIEDRPTTGDSRLARFAHRYLPTTRLYVNTGAGQSTLTDSTLPFGWSQVAGAQLTEETLDKNFADALQRLWGSYTSDVGRSVRIAQAKGLANILKAVMSGDRLAPQTKVTLDLQLAYDSARQFLERQGSQNILGTFPAFVEQYNSDPSLQAVVQDIYNVEREIEAVTHPQKRLEDLIQRLYSGNKKLIFSEKAITVESDNGDQIGLESLSSGEKQLMRISVECLGAGPNSILIDEPEISIHIDWQRELMAILRSLNDEAQFIVATHSPEIMAEILDERLILL